MADEADGEIRKDVWAVTAVDCVGAGGGGDGRVFEAGADCFDLPDAVLVKADVLGAGADAAASAFLLSFEAVELPFAGDAGGVAGLFQVVGEGLFVAVHHAENDVIAVVIFAGHHLHAGGAAQGSGVGVSELHPASSEAVEVGGLVDVVAITGDSLSAEVVGHYEDYVWWGGGGGDGGASAGCGLGWGGGVGLCAGHMDLGG